MVVSQLFLSFLSCSCFLKAKLSSPTETSTIFLFFRELCSSYPLKLCSSYLVRSIDNRPLLILGHPLYIYIWILSYTIWYYVAATPNCRCCWELWSRNKAPGRLVFESSWTSISLSLFLNRIATWFATFACSSKSLFTKQSSFNLVPLLNLLHDKMCSCVSSCGTSLLHSNGHFNDILYIFGKLWRMSDGIFQMSRCLPYS